MQLADFRRQVIFSIFFFNAFVEILMEFVVKL